MSVDTTLDSSFGLLLAKARSGISGGTLPSPGGSTGGSTGTTTSPRTATVNFEWGGGGSALSAGSCDPVLIEIPFDSEIMWVHLYAGTANGAPVAVTATLDLRITRWATFGGSSPVYGSGTSPRITADSLANMSLSGWFVNLTPGDVLIARILTFSGAATFLSMNIFVRSTDVSLGVAAVTDNAADPMTDNSGDPMVFRT